MAGQIGNEHGEPLRREAARKIRHDDFVGGEAVKQNDGTALGILRDAGFLHNVHSEGARAGVDEIVVHGEAARGVGGESRSEKEKQAACGGENGILMFHVEAAPGSESVKERDRLAI